MIDPILLLDASSEEDAWWMAVREADQDAGVAFVARARALARAATLARQAGRTDFIADELMACLRVDRTTARRTLHESLMLTTLPRTCEALEEGRLGVPHARVLIDELAVLTPDQAATVESNVLPHVDDRPPSRVRELVRRAVLVVDPEAAERRRTTARAARRLAVQPDADGMAWIRLLVPAEQALAVLAAADEQTCGPDAAGRSADQRRADWALAQLLSAAGSPRPARATSPTSDPYPADPVRVSDAEPVGVLGDVSVADAVGTPDDEPVGVPTGEPVRAAAAGQVGCSASRHVEPVDVEPPLDRRRRRRFQALITVPVAVALGLSDEPCDLAGYGPITAAHGRELLAEAELRRICVDSLTGQVVAVDDLVYRPVPDDDPSAAHRDPDTPAPRASRTSRKPRRRWRPGPPAGTGRNAPLGSTGADVLDDALRQARAVRACLIGMVLSPASEPVEAEEQYRPSAGLSRTVAMRDVACTFPCCSASVCDDDHLRPWPRGATHASNLHRLSRHHHRAKQAGWIASPMSDGSTLWQAPSGRTYRRPPARPAPPPVGPGARLSPPAPPPRFGGADRVVDQPCSLTSLPAPSVASPVVTLETRRPDARRRGPATKRGPARTSRPPTLARQDHAASVAEIELSLGLDPPPF